MLEFFGSLLPYYGGKRKLAGRIMSYAEGETFIDGFLGGGSVSLLAKAKGYRVLANDLADRSVIIGRALLENDEVLLEESDIVRLYADNPEDKHFIRENYPEQFKPELAEFLDRARANIERLHDPVKRALLLLLWMKILCYYRPMSSFGHVNAVAQLEQEDSTDTLLRLREHYSRPLYEVLLEIKKMGRLPVVNFAAGGIATPADAAFMMQLGADGVFIGSGIFKSSNPEAYARAIVEAVQHWDEPEVVAEVSKGIGEAMKGLDVFKLSEKERLQERGV